MNSLQDQLLIAMPSLDDGYFNKTVTYICEHSEKGAMGLIINLPINITLFELLKQIDEEEDEEDDDSPNVNSDVNLNVNLDMDINEYSTQDYHQSKNNEQYAAKTTEKDKIDTESIDEQNSLKQLVLSGGPMGQSNGFVLHSTQKGWGSSLVLNKELMITTSKDILLALGTTDAPKNFMVTLGYASWGPGQLEEELQTNTWLTTPADNEIIFNTPIELRWKKATDKLGIDLAHLSNEVGHA
jgi:putative transcriptional regulator